ncbi:hypothetical protein [Anaerotignum sp. MB30-C6]|uniref:hypothetical protein n=1 Tax=Anaerotignum sp. MB30-C6 TaxID=3070814 RepID=UPI0027DBD68A|nr:hypothetical protein [Anaerotignum sp. MB30-C6]WMI81823.1 hypothetical protein RBQ60_03600 [Anaerotignum sp. MB30-C6]
MEPERNKPPLGIAPERFWKEDRLKEIERAISERIGTTFDIPLEWLVERNSLLRELKGARWIE